MPRTCTICTHEEREAIDAALVNAAALAESLKETYVTQESKDRLWAFVEWLLDTSDVYADFSATSPQLRRYLELWGDLEDVLGPFPSGRTPIPKSVRKKLIKRCGQQCQYCGGEGDKTQGPDGRPWHIDHVVPVALGGTDDEDNLTLACASCNLKKSDRLVSELGWCNNAQQL